MGTVEKMKISSTDYSLSIPTYVLAFKQGGTLTENLFRKRCSGRWLLYTAAIFAALKNSRINGLIDFGHCHCNSVHNEQIDDIYAHSVQTNEQISYAS